MRCQKHLTFVMSLSLGTGVPREDTSALAGLSSQGPSDHTQDAMRLIRFEATPIWSVEMHQVGVL